jgi:two-component system, OmpR family, alkaline phosphatase synthesis response regulator PhoP
MAKEKILVIEDDEDILELMVHNLSREGFIVSGAGNGEAGLRKLQNEEFNLVILDIMLPGIDGLEVCKAIRQNASLKHLPIIMVTAKGEEADVVAGLELGADDYIIKPFSPRILIARLKSILRRRSRESTDDKTPVTINNLAIHPGRHEVLVNGKPIELTHMEFRVLQFLASRPGWVFTRYQIMDNVRGDNYPVTDRAVDVIIVGIRKKLGDAGDLIETVRGVGYRFKEQDAKS